MDDVNVPLVCKWMTAEENYWAAKCAKDWKEWRILVRMWMIEFHAAIFV